MPRSASALTFQNRSLFETREDFAGRRPSDRVIRRGVLPKLVSLKVPDDANTERCKGLNILTLKLS
jgi:hypothetical protein